MDIVPDLWRKVVEKALLRVIPFDTTASKVERKVTVYQTKRDNFEENASPNKPALSKNGKYKPDVYKTNPYRQLYPNNVTLLQP